MTGTGFNYDKFKFILYSQLAPTWQKGTYSGGKESAQKLWMYPSNISGEFHSFPPALSLFFTYPLFGNQVMHVSGSPRLLLFPQIVGCLSQFAG